MPSAPILLTIKLSYFCFFMYKARVKITTSVMWRLHGMPTDKGGFLAWVTRVLKYQQLPLLSSSFWAMHDQPLFWTKLEPLTSCVSSSSLLGFPAAHCTSVGTWNCSWTLLVSTRVHHSLQVLSERLILYSIIPNRLLPDHICLQGTFISWVRLLHLILGVGYFWERRLFCVASC